MKFEKRSFRDTTTISPGQFDGIDQRLVYYHLPLKMTGSVEDGGRTW